MIKKMEVGGFEIHQSLGQLQFGCFIVHVGRSNPDLYMTETSISIWRSGIYAPDYLRCFE